MLLFLSFPETARQMLEPTYIPVPLWSSASSFEPVLGSLHCLILWTFPFPSLSLIQGRLPPSPQDFCSVPPLIPSLPFAGNLVSPLPLHPWITTHLSLPAWALLDHPFFSEPSFSPPLPPLPIIVLSVFLSHRGGPYEPGYSRPLFSSRCHPHLRIFKTFARCFPPFRSPSASPSRPREPSLPIIFFEFTVKRPDPLTSFFPPSSVLR